LIDQTPEGCTAVIPPGTYQGTLVINKPLTIVGVDSASTIIEGTTDWDEITVNTSGIRILGLTIRNFNRAIRANQWERGIGFNNIVIEDCCFIDCGCPVSFWNVTKSRISNNLFYKSVHQSGSQVYIARSDTVVVSNNDFSGACLYLDQFNKDCLIKGNFIRGENTYSAIGLIIQDSWNNTITENSIVCHHIGISDTYNLCGNNPMPNKSLNHFYLNNFIQNVIQVNLYYDPYGCCNVTDLWDRNYWSDYSGNDTDLDGFGDEPYIINDHNQDNYPLMFDPIPPNVPQENGCEQFFYNGLIVMETNVNITYTSGYIAFRAIRVVIR